MQKLVFLFVLLLTTAKDKSKKLAGKDVTVAGQAIKLEEYIGSGDCAAVYKTNKPGLGLKVELQNADPGCGSSQLEVETLRQLTARGVNTRGGVGLKLDTDGGLHEFTLDGTTYKAFGLDYVDAGRLKTWLRARRSAWQTANTGKSLLEFLGDTELKTAYTACLEACKIVWGAGIINGDLHMSNMLYTPGKPCRIIDFGSRNGKVLAPGNLEDLKTRVASDWRTFLISYIAEAMGVDDGDAQVRANAPKYDPQSTEGQTNPAWPALQSVWTAYGAITASQQMLYSQVAQANVSQHILENPFTLQNWLFLAVGSIIGFFFRGLFSKRTFSLTSYNLLPEEEI